MQIVWFGLSCFKIISRDLTLFTDPFGKASGLLPPRGTADIIVSSSPNDELHNNFSSLSGEHFVVDGAGEYDIKGVFIRGIDVAEKSGAASKTSPTRQTIYAITIEGINMGFLGRSNQKMLSEKDFEELNDVDILFIPVGGRGVFEAEPAVAVVNQLEPKVVIPAHYKTPGLSLALDPLDRFLKEMGSKGEQMDKLVIKKNDFEAEKTRLVILSPQRS